MVIPPPTPPYVIWHEDFMFSACTTHIPPMQRTKVHPLTPRLGVWARCSHLAQWWVWRVVAIALKTSSSSSIISCKGLISELLHIYNHSLIMFMSWVERPAGILFVTFQELEKRSMQGDLWSFGFSFLTFLSIKSLFLGLCFVPRAMLVQSVLAC